ncbi:hypothetical protein FRB99_000301 [Tulasnella sp. 403]|nr:hypothetical protein FRB99_000301 [Tulasnella sp. 403]
MLFPTRPPSSIQITLNAESNVTTRPRYRRDADDAAELPARDTTSRPLRTTFSQASQMGSFRHQSSLQSLKLDTTIDKERDRDGHERLRNLSDRFDRDRGLRSAAASDLQSSFANLSSATGRRDRDSATHLSSNNRQGSNTSISTTNGRREGRVPDRDRDRDSSSRTNGTRAAHERSSNVSKDLSEARNDRSDDWRRADRWDDRDKPRTSDRDNRRSRSRDRRDGGWGDDRDREKRSHSREPRSDDRRGWDNHRDKDRDRDPWYRAPGGRDDDRDRRKEEEAPIVPLRSTRRDRGAERDRDREREPAWMDDWAPDTPASGGKGMILGGANGEMDKLQVWKKAMKEKEAGVVAATSSGDIPSESKSAPDEVVAETPVLGTDSSGLNDIEKFKLAMKAQNAKQLDHAPSPTVNQALNGAPPGLGVSSTVPNDLSPPDPRPLADPAILVASNSTSARNTPPLHANGTGEGTPISLETLGLPLSASQTPSLQQAQDSSMLFKALFNTSPPKPDALSPASTKPSIITEGLNKTAATTLPPTSIDSKPSAQNVFASFLTESRHPTKVNGTPTKPTDSVDAFSATSTSPANPGRPTNQNPMSLPLGAAPGAGGRTSKFAKFFSNPSASKDDPTSHQTLPSGPAGLQGPQTLHHSQPSLGGREAMLNQNNMGLPGYGPSPAMGMNGMIGAGGTMGVRMSSPGLGPTPPQAQAQPQHVVANNAVPPRLGSAGLSDPLAGLFANATERLGGPASTGGTMEGFLAALDSSARQSGPRPPNRYPAQPSISKPAGSPFGVQTPNAPQFSQQQGTLQFPPYNPGGLNEMSDGGRFVADNMVPGLRPPRTREPSLSMSSVGGYPSDRDERELVRGLQNVHLMHPPSAPPQHQQGVFDQRQQQLLARHQQQQTLYSNQGQPQNRGVGVLGMMDGGAGVGMAGVGVGMRGSGPSPSPIGNQNPMNLQRGYAGRGQDLIGMGMGVGGMRPQDLGAGMRGNQDLGNGIGPIRTPQDLGMLRGGNTAGGNAGVDLGYPNQQFGMSQRNLNGGLNPMGGMQPSFGNNVGALGPTVGPPGGGDYMFQNLPAARAAAQQVQLMQNMGIRGNAPLPPPHHLNQHQHPLGGQGQGQMGHPNPRLEQQLAQQRGMGTAGMGPGPQHLMGPPPSQGGPNGFGDFGVGLGAGGAHGPHSHTAEQFLQLFLGNGAAAGNVTRE